VDHVCGHKHWTKNRTTQLFGRARLVNRAQLLGSEAMN